MLDKIKLNKKISKDRCCKLGAQLSEIRSVFVASGKEPTEHPTSDSRERARDYTVRHLSMPCAGLSTPGHAHLLCFVPPISRPQVQRYSAYSVVASHIRKQEPENRGQSNYLALLSLDHNCLSPKECI